MKSIVLLLAHASAEQVNCCVSMRDLRTPLHLSCFMGNLPIAQLLIWVSYFPFSAADLIGHMFVVIF